MEKNNEVEVEVFCATKRAPSRVVSVQRVENQWKWACEVLVAVIDSTTPTYSYHLQHKPTWPQSSRPSALKLLKQFFCVQLLRFTRLLRRRGRTVPP